MVKYKITNGEPRKFISEGRSASETSISIEDVVDDLNQLQSQLATLRSENDRLREYQKKADEQYVQLHSLYTEQSEQLATLRSENEQLKLNEKSWEETAKRMIKDEMKINESLRSELKQLKQKEKPVYVPLIDENGVCRLCGSTGWQCDSDSHK